MIPIDFLQCGSPTSRRKTAHSSWRPWWLLSLIAAGIVPGCNTEPAFEFDTLDLVPTQDEMTELSLGKYSIPIPIRAENGDQLRISNRVQLDFELHALVARGEKSRIADAWQRHNGKIRDRVIRVCRNASLDELQEPELATLKAHLMDAVQAQLGDKEIRQLLMTEIVSEQL